MEKLKKIKMFSIINIICFIGMVFVNGLANSLPINGKTTGELSSQYPNLFTPAGFTFSIWGIIYLSVGIFTIYGLFCAFTTKELSCRFLNKINIFFAISCFANIGWIFAWHYELVELSVIIMFILLFTLGKIYKNLNVENFHKDKKEKYLVDLPFSIYLGWISVASIANISAFLVNIKLQMFASYEVIWTIIMIITAILLGIIFLFKKNDIFYTLVIDWALLGILFKRLYDEQIFLSIIIVTAAGLGIITILIILQTIKKNFIS